MRVDFKREQAAVVGRFLWAGEDLGRLVSGAIFWTNRRCLGLGVRLPLKTTSELCNGWLAVVICGAKEASFNPLVLGVAGVDTLRWWGNDFF